MAHFDIELWEPEESVGKIWHTLVSGLDASRDYAEASASLDEMRGRLSVLFRGLTNAQDVEIKPAPFEASEHRLSWRRALGQPSEHFALASFDGEVLRLPEHIAAFPERDANRGLYLWLTAAAAFAHPPHVATDPLRADIRTLQAAYATVRATLEACPGLRNLYARLVSRTRELRPARSLPQAEAALEAAIRHMLGGPPPSEPNALAMSGAITSETADLSLFSAPRGYRRFLPILLWPDARNAPARLSGDGAEDGSSGSPAAEDQKQRIVRAARKSSDQAARKDSLILHKFEQILSWAEFLNINRRVEDDDEDNAQKAADDLDEIGLARVPQQARTRLKLHLDLSPEDVDFERLAGLHIYPEWDHRTKTYLPEYCRVLTGDAKPAETLPTALTAKDARRRIARVKRQFEALRPKRIFLARQVDGEDIDVEAAIAARVDLAASGTHSDRVYRSSRNQERDLAVSILLDCSRSTETIIAGRQVLDIAREALVALAWGLDALGDATSIDAFSSLRRDRVFVHGCKDFSEPMGQGIEARIAGLRPGHYTRLGAAIRHVSQKLAREARQRRLLLVLTDGKPNDLDHYEGRHGVEDTHMAVREARRQGQAVFGITIDQRAQATFARIFGNGGFAVVPHPEKLTTALPELYRQMVGA